MTRFMMTLDDAVDLVIYAFQHGKNGDLFVQKAPAATLDVLADALKSLYHSTRDLNYDKFFVEGSEEVSKIEDYHSHNTRRLDVEGMKELLLKLDFIRKDLALEEK